MINANQVKTALNFHQVCKQHQWVAIQNAEIKLTENLKYIQDPMRFLFVYRALKESPVFSANLAFANYVREIGRHNPLAAHWLINQEFPPNTFHHQILTRNLRLNLDPNRL